MENRLPVKALGQFDAFRAAGRAMHDHRVGKRHVGGPTAEIVLQKVDFGTATLLKFQNKSGLRTPPFVDGLVVVADDHQIGVGPGDQFHQFGLGQIHILKFVHQQAGIGRLDGFEQAGVGHQQFPGGRDHIVVADPAPAAAHIFVEAEEGQIPGPIFRRAGLGCDTPGRGGKLDPVQIRIGQIAFAAGHKAEKVLLIQPVQLRRVLHFAPPGLVQRRPENTPLYAVEAPFVPAGFGQESQFACLAHNSVAQAVKGLDLYPLHAPPL